MESKISKQIEEGERFTLMVDATTDKSIYEIESILCRYIVEGTKEDDIELQCTKRILPQYMLLKSGAD